MGGRGMFSLRAGFGSFLLMAALAGCASSGKIPVPAHDVIPAPADLLKPATFVPHEGAGFMSYLAMNLDKSAADKLRKNLEKKESLQLMNRGESHITVISPPEFKVLSRYLRIQDITRIAEEMKIEESPVKALCLGKSVVKLDSEPEATYYVVVSSVRLLEIREAIQKIYVSKGGNATDFKPDFFYPHITLGFTKRDLFYEDGIVKDVNSCFLNLKFEK